MHTHTDTHRESKCQAASIQTSRVQRHGAPGFTFVESSRAPRIRQLSAIQELADNSWRAQQAMQLRPVRDNVASRRELSPVSTSPSPIQLELGAFRKLHTAYRALGAKLGTREDTDHGATLNRQIAEVGNDIARITGIEFSETPHVYQVFVLSENVISFDMDWRPNTPLGNNLISLSLTTKGELLLAEIITAATMKNKRIYFTKGDWSVEEKEDGKYVVKVDILKPVEERHRSIDRAGAPQLRPDMVLLGHEMGHLRDKLLSEEDAPTRETQYDQLAHRYSSKSERDQRWSNIREWGVTVFHENPLAEELGLPARGEYNPKQTLDSEAGFLMLSRQIGGLVGRANALAALGDNKFVGPVGVLSRRFLAMGPAPDGVAQRLKFEEYLDRNGPEILSITNVLIRMDSALDKAEQAVNPPANDSEPIVVRPEPAPSRVRQALQWLLSWTPFG